MAERVTPQSVDFSRWYTDVVQQAGLADYAPVRGCMVIKPYGYALWENIQRALDDMFKATGHQNAYFPLLIPESYLKREADHVEGFAPEVAVVTHAGGEELEERLIIRPTSETIIGEMFSRWIQSYRDLPLLINQWANVVRWELRTRLFLRTSEFLWQEGHTAHTTHEEAREEQARMVDTYRALAEDWGAVPVHVGEKTPGERFGGALSSLSIEALMRDGKALQSGTSHDLGQNFARAFNISYQGEDGQRHLPWQTSWGASTRLVGMLIMAHGDETGLILPPRLAPHQVVIVPIQRTDYAGDTAAEARTLAAELRAAGVRVHVDERDLSPGYRFTDWEIRGVPVRVELGPKDVDAGQVTAARRDRPGREGKAAISREGAVTALRTLLDEVQQALFDRAMAFREEHTFTPKSDAELYELLEESAGFARVPVAVTDEMEETLRERGKAAVRVLVAGADVSGERCIITGAPATDEALIARAY